MNLLSTLLSHAHGDEVPITAALAWFLRESPALRAAVLGRWVKLLPRLGAIPREAPGAAEWAEPTVAVELTVADPLGGACRYDLVLDWYVPSRFRLIVESKVWAGLTMKDEPDLETDQLAPVDQLQRYLRLARREGQPPTVLILLAPAHVDLVSAVRTDPMFAGQLAWQSVHDAFQAVLRASAQGAPGLDPTMRHLAAGFIDSLETRRMTAPRLTFDALTSVSRYRRFHQSVESLLEHARARLFEEGKVAGFSKGDRRAWQDDHDRIGWRLWVNPSVVSYFAFVGVHVGEGTIHEEVPDLYFFLEAAPRTKAASELDARLTLIDAALAPLRSETVQWKVQPGGYEAIQARMSMVEIVRAANPEDAATTFFADCFGALRKNGELQRFLDACNAGGG